MNTKNRNKRKNSFVALCLLALPLASAAQNNEVVTSTYFSNALFNTLLATIILLAILVIALSNVLKNVSNSELLANLLKNKEGDKKNDSGVKTTAILFFMMLSSVSTFAQNKAALVKDDRIGGIDQFTFYFMIVVIVLELMVIGVLIHTLRYLLKSNQVKPSVVTANKPKEKTILDILSDAVEVENEEAILLDHDYDGIKELDNNLPPWWKYGFYLTILVGVVYLINYHVIKSSPLQAEEYANSIKKADAEIAEFMKTSANNVDENSVKLLTATSDINTGKELFLSTCAACHGKFGEGTVGPNLTDDYWLHTGSVKEIFKTIKYGYPDKGMKSWKEDFSPMQIAQLTSYIKTLRGTNPPKPKDKQGDLYLEESAAPSDSTLAPNDSLKVVSIQDTLKK